MSNSNSARKRKNDRVISEAAEGVAGLSPLVGVRQEDLTEALKATAFQLIKQPLVAAKHSASLAGKLVDVVAGKTEYTVARKDRRFADESWQESGFYRRVLQAYLALDESFDQWIDDLELADDDDRKARFVADILTDSVAPSNNLLTNPAALKKARATRGGSLVQGMRHLASDWRHNNRMPSQVDKSQFEVGVNMANTPGNVVFRNDMLELIQYAPQTGSVSQVPMLIIPPQINKFYVFDVSPAKSMFKFLVEQGNTVFAVSWRNPTAKERHWSLDDYIAALVDAAEAVSEISGQPRFNLMGACSGGITASIFAAYLNAKNVDVVNTLTLMVCVLDQQRNDSDVTLFASEDGLERARKASAKKGILDGKELSRVFNLMRPNDLIWNYVVNNYLMGNKPPAFDILFWNNDTTNLPAQLHSDFLDLMQSNPLVTPGDLTVLGEAIDLSGLTYDKYMVGGTTDHITPWHACYRSTQLMGGDIRFILSNSGHIQAMVNPPGNPKSNFFTRDDLPESSADWQAGAEQQMGTWWHDWAEWLSAHGGRRVRARKSVGRKDSYPPLEAAPGTYVY